jgi:nitroreductase
MALLERLAVVTECEVPVQGPTVERTREEVWKKAKIDYEGFVMCRHSVRNFSSEPVPEDAIKRAVRMAQKAPSACNRQGSRVHIYSLRHDLDKILGMQSGNRGFGHLASHIAIITVDLRCFADGVERHQAWVDGGLFAMSFIFALHSLGYGSCALNWSVEEQTDRELRNFTKVEDFEEIILLLAIGSLPDKFKVAASVRKSLEDVLRFH